MSLAGIFAELRVRDMAAPGQASGGDRSERGKLAVQDDLDTPQVLHVLADVESVVVDATLRCFDSELGTSPGRRGGRDREPSNLAPQVVHAVVIGHVHASPLVSAPTPVPTLVRCCVMFPPPQRTRLPDVIGATVTGGRGASPPPPHESVLTQRLTR